MTISGMDSVVFFGNEKLATGIAQPELHIQKAIKDAGFTIEKSITGPLELLGEHTSKLAVLAAYGHIIPRKILAEFPLGIINIHPSLLPEYRGSTPIEQTILDGKTKTGVSIMKLEAGMDTGPIYKQKTIHLTGEETKQELTAVPSIAAGTLKPRSQPHPDRATYTRLITKAHGAIDLSKPASELEREIRAFAGWPNSYTQLGDINVIITGAHVSSEASDLSLLESDGNYLVIDTLKALGKKEMPVKAFLAGYKNRL